MDFTPDFDLTSNQFSGQELTWTSYNMQDIFTSIDG